MLRNSAALKHTKEEMNFCKVLLEKLLSLQKCEEHYRVDIESGMLYLRESSTNPPRFEHRVKIQNTVQALGTREMITFSSGTKKKTEGCNVYNIQYWKLKEIDIQIIKEALSMREGEMLENVDATLWEAWLNNEISSEQSNRRQNRP